ncbi:MAG: hypothetical protein HY536_01390 [Candidatus Colwellbacteria bacterium]|nr:hypothetical protein [Candidatus Colwellbacteria bacterium]
MPFIRYPNLIVFAASVAVAVALAQTGFFDSMTNALGSYGYLGAFVTGFFFSFSFTTALATANFYSLGQMFHPVGIALVGAVGAVVADITILKIVKGTLLKELGEIEEGVSRRIHLERFVELFHTKVFHAFGLVLGGLIILSPLPDELGIAILAAYRLTPERLVPISYVLNATGIFFIAGIAGVL